MGFVQLNIKFGDKERNVKEALKLMRNVDAGLLVLPELFNTGYTLTSKEEALKLAEEIPHGKTTKELIDYSIEKGMYIVAGLIEREEGKIFNSAVVTGPEGYIGKYRKSHLFYYEKKWFEPGDTGFQIFHLKNLKVKVGVIICFDWIFPEASRSLALKGAEIICHPANLVLPYAQKAMLTRAIENKVFIITSNRVGREKRGIFDFKFTGMSQVTSPRMKVLVRASQEREEVRTVDINVEEARNKKITEMNDLLKDRRPELYLDLTKRET